MLWCKRCLVLSTKVYHCIQTGGTPIKFEEMLCLEYVAKSQHVHVPLQTFGKSVTSQCSLHVF